MAAHSLPFHTIYSIRNIHKKKIIEWRSYLDCILVVSIVYLLWLDAFEAAFVENERRRKKNLNDDSDLRSFLFLFYISHISFQHDYCSSDGFRAPTCWIGCWLPILTEHVNEMKLNKSGKKYKQNHLMHLDSITMMLAHLIKNRK